MKLDFSEFHPLDHHVLSLRCTHLPGGGRRHIELWLDYQAPRPWEWTRRHTFCRIGRHRAIEVWHKKEGQLIEEMFHEPPTAFECNDCGVQP